MTRRRALTVVLAVTAGTALFAALQRTGARGGVIGVPKALWLNLTVLSFVALPTLACSDRRLPAGVRRCFAAVAASFAARGAVEVPILYLTDAWHCSYGIAHDLGTAAVAGGLWLVARRQVAPPAAHGLIGFTVALCLIEAGFARAFCAVADPATTWFASADPRFAAINTATWVVVGLAYPLLAVLLWRTTASRGAGTPTCGDDGRRICAPSGEKRHVRSGPRPVDDRSPLTRKASPGL